MKRTHVFVLLFFFAMWPLGTSVERAGAASRTYRKSIPSGLTGKIAFSSFRNGNFEIWLMNADGTHQTTVTGTEESDRLERDYYNSPSLSHDGKKLVFIGIPFGNPEIYVTNLNGSHDTEGQRLTSLATSNQDGDHPGPKPSFSPDGQKIVFNSNFDPSDGSHSNQEIYVINVDKTHQTRLTKDGGYTDPGYIHPDSFDPAFSPDGKKIVFVSDRVFHSFGKQNEIFIMNADGTEQTQLTHDDYNDVSPCFSPDGKHVAYVSVREGKAQIFVMNVDGSNSLCLNKNIRGGTPCFSPDGKHIVYESADEKQPGIFVMNSDGTHPIRLTSGTYDDSPSWSVEFVPTPPKTLKHK